MTGPSAYDYVIVGAGSAGCVLANRLSEDGRNRVLVLEAGPRDDHLAIRVPAAAASLLGSRYDWAYRTEPQRCLEDREVPWARGKTLGGSSSINAQVYLRGHRADFDCWARLGNGGWSFDEVLPYFHRAEHNENPTSSLHGMGGPLNVAKQRDPNPLTQVFVQACAETGIPYNEDLNGTAMDGVGLPRVTQRNGLRWSAADAYLRPALDRPNVTVVTDAHVTSVLCEGGRAIGVRYLLKGRSMHVARAESEVLLSGGVVNSPQLLLLSGIGPAEHLRERGVDVVHDLPGVGHNLQDHIAVTLFVPMGPVAAPTARSVVALGRFLLFRRGVLTSNESEACAFVRTRPELSEPDLELVFAAPPLNPVLLTPRWAAHYLRRRWRRSRQGRFRTPTRRIVGIAPVVLQPRSVGVLRLRSPDPRDPPVIDPRYLSDAAGHDLRVLVAGIELSRRILGTSAFAPHLHDNAALSGSGPSPTEFIRQSAGSLQHPVGTCKMGVDTMAVVDPQLRVHGIRGLRVVDASIMPVIPRGHINAPTIMIAEKAAEMIRAGGRGTTPDTSDGPR